MDNDVSIFWKSAVTTVVVFVVIMLPLAFYWDKIKKFFKGLWLATAGTIARWAIAKRKKED